nr:MAG TPA: hypothetical protein [Bacteriophage sp.]
MVFSFIFYDPNNLSLRGDYKKIRGRQASPYMHGYYFIYASMFAF